MAFLLEVLDLDGDLVRHLGTKLPHDFLAYQLGGKKAAAAIGDLVFREEMLALGQALGDQVFQRFQILSMLCGNRHDLGVGQLLGEPAQMRQQLGLVLDAVGLVHRHDQRPGNVL